MAYTSQAEVQTALYQTIAPGGVVDAPLTSLGVNGVYDWMNVPQNAPFDYITFGDGYEQAKDTLGTAGHSNGFMYYAMIHIWSRQANTANASAMLDRLNALFHRQPLNGLVTLTHVYTQIWRTNWLYDTQGNTPTLHIAHQYQIYTVQQ